MFRSIPVDEHYKRRRGCNQIRKKRSRGQREKGEVISLDTKPRHFELKLGVLLILVVKFHPRTDVKLLQKLYQIKSR
jgi:hypothetical protein